MNIKELVCIGSRDQPVTDSRKVAAHFEKEHRNVIKRIKELLNMGVLQNEQGIKMFEEAMYYDESNNQHYPMYIITRDGFSMLAMGFTGKKDIQFKLQYTDAFNKMADYIKQKEMENQPSTRPVIPKNYAEDLELAAAQVR